MPPLRRAIIGLAAVGLLAAGCSRDHGPTPSAREFVTEAAQTSTVDYEPLASPQYALAHSTVAIEGTLKTVLPGPTYSHGDPVTDSRTTSEYMVLVVHVTRVVSGSAEALGGDTLYARHLMGNTSPEKLNKILPDARVVAITSEPVPVTATSLPKGIPTDATLFEVYVDGIWFQGSEDSTMVGIYASPADLPESWNKPTTIDEFVARLTDADKG